MEIFQGSVLLFFALSNLIAFVNGIRQHYEKVKYADFSY